jgi:PPOX class probable F420-dependent enzyme
MSEVKIEGRAAERLGADTVGWLVTVSPTGQPQSSPVWFLFDDASIYIQSQPDAAKLRNIAGNERVSFHLDDDGRGSDIVIVEGRADLLPAAPAPLFDRYAAKYGALMRELFQATADDLAAAYSVTIRVTPTHLRAW